jgi:hypothetical protein
MQADHLSVFLTHVQVKIRDARNAIVRKLMNDVSGLSNNNEYFESDLIWRAQEDLNTELTKCINSYFSTDASSLCTTHTVQYTQMFLTHTPLLYANHIVEIIRAGVRAAKSDKYELIKSLHYKCEEKLKSVARKYESSQSLFEQMRVENPEKAGNKLYACMLLSNWELIYSDVDAMLKEHENQLCPHS